MLPWYLKGPETEFTQDGQKVRLLLSNVFTDNRQTGRLISLIGREQPDLLVLQEVNFRLDARAGTINALISLFRVTPESG